MDASAGTHRQCILSEKAKKKEWLVLFDVDGTTTVVRRLSDFCDPEAQLAPSSRTTMKWGKDKLEVEIVGVGDTETINSLDASWPTTHRAKAIMRERKRRAGEEGHYLAVWPEDLEGEVEEEELLGEVVGEEVLGVEVEGGEMVHVGGSEEEERPAKRRRKENSTGKRMKKAEPKQTKKKKSDGFIPSKR